MYCVWKLCVSKIKRKKTQVLLISFILLLSTLLLSTAVVIINNTGNLYLDMHSELNGSHEILQLRSGIYNPDEINAWWKVQDGVAASDVMRYRNLTGISVQGKDINADLYLYMVDTPSTPQPVDKLVFAKGTEQPEPDPGTIWIPTSVAYKNDIAIGDEVIFRTNDGEFGLKVSGIVIDLPYCSPFSSSARIWMNGNDYSQHIYSAQANDYYMMSLRFDDYAGSRAYWEKFEAHLGTPYLESVTTFESLSSFYMVINRLIGFIMIFFAIVMMVIAVFSIGFTISDDIISNYKTIGIVKSLGMTSFQTICVNITQYGVLAFLSVTPGIILSYFLSRVIVTSSLSYLKSDNSALNLHFMPTACGVFFFLMFVIVICVFVFSYKSRRIQPVQAIRYGRSEKDNNKSARHMSYVGKKVARFDRLPITLALGLRTMLKKFRSDVFIIIISALMTAVLVFSFTFLNSIISSNQIMAMLGYDSSDITVRAENISDTAFIDFMNDLQNDKRIENYNMYTDIDGVIPADKNLETGDVSADSMSITLAVVDGSYDDIGVVNLEGRSPANENEISIGVNIAKTYDKGIGDTIDLYIRGQKCRFEITGVYQAIANMSYSARICVESVTKIDPLYSIKDVVFVNLYDNTSSAAFLNDLKKYGAGMSASTKEELISEVFSQAVPLLAVPLLIIGIAFVLIVLIIIFCNCHISIKKEITTYGVYKSLGMRSSKIRFSISFGIIALELIGAVIGLLLGIGLLPNLLNVVLSTYGIVNMPLVIDYAGIIIVAMIGIFIASLGSWFASKDIQKDSPRLLTIE